VQIQLTASVVFHMPVIRDLVSWAGFRQVLCCDRLCMKVQCTCCMKVQCAYCGPPACRSYTALQGCTVRCVDLDGGALLDVECLLQVARKTFVAALQERGSVLFVPGGQAELVHTHRTSAKCREWVAYTGHKGRYLLRARFGLLLQAYQTYPVLQCYMTQSRGMTNNRAPPTAAGFVRLAIEQQAALVPIVVLGEINCLRNFIDAPGLTRSWASR
jgi:hypothetical protein